MKSLLILSLALFTSTLFAQEQYWRPSYGCIGGWVQDPDIWARGSVGPHGSSSGALPSTRIPGQRRCLGYGYFCPQGTYLASNNFCYRLPEKKSSLESEPSSTSNVQEAYYYDNSSNGQR